MTYFRDLTLIPRVFIFKLELNDLSAKQGPGAGPSKSNEENLRAAQAHIEEQRKQLQMQQKKFEESRKSIEAKAKQIEEKEKSLNDAENKLKKKKESLDQMEAELKKVRIFQKSQNRLISAHIMHPFFLDRLLQIRDKYKATQINKSRNYKNKWKSWLTNYKRLKRKRSALRVIWKDYWT